MPLSKKRDRDRVRRDYILDAGFPRFTCIRNPENTHWILGWMTGIDTDLVCVLPNVKTRALEHYALSPVCSNRAFALIAFLAKRLLLLIDENARGL